MSERETTIVMTDETTAEIYTCQNNWINRMEKLGIQPTRTSDSMNMRGCWYEIPKILDQDP